MTSETLLDRLPVSDCDLHLLSTFIIISGHCKQQNAYNGPHGTFEQAPYRHALLSKYSLAQSYSTQKVAGKFSRH